jgi:hypothetical protein
MWIVDGEVKHKTLDEYPMSLEGEPIGWGLEGDTEDRRADMEA